MITADDLRKLAKVAGLPMRLSEEALAAEAEAIGETFDKYVLDDMRADASPLRGDTVDWATRIGQWAKDGMTLLGAPEGGRDAVTIFSDAWPADGEDATRLAVALEALGILGEESEHSSTKRLLALNAHFLSALQALANAVCQDAPEIKRRRGADHARHRLMRRLAGHYEALFVGKNYVTNRNSRKPPDRGYVTTGPALRWTHELFAIASTCHEKALADAEAEIAGPQATITQEQLAERAKERADKIAWARVLAAQRAPIATLVEWSSQPGWGPKEILPVAHWQSHSRSKPKSEDI